MRITECHKSTVACNVGNAQCDNEIVKCEEKIQVRPNVRNVRSNVILKKVKESPNVTKELSYMILKPHNVRMKLSNVRKKKVRELPNVKKIVTCDVGTAQCEDETVKYEKKVWEPPNVIKELSYVILKPQNVRMELSNARKKKK